MMTRLIEEARKEGAPSFRDLCPSGGLSQDVPAIWEEESGKMKTGARVPRPNEPLPMDSLAKSKDMILATVNQPRFAALSPAQTVPVLADEGSNNAQNTPDVGIPTLVRTSFGQ